MIWTFAAHWDGNNVKSTSDSSTINHSSKQQVVNLKNLSQCCVVSGAMVRKPVIAINRMTILCFDSNNIYLKKNTFHAVDYYNATQLRDFFLELVCSAALQFFLNFFPLWLSFPPSREHPQLRRVDSNQIASYYGGC